MAEAISGTDNIPALGKLTAPADSVQASLLLAFLASAGLYYVNIFPAITNALMEGAGLSTVEAGQITSANAMGAAFGALLAAYTGIKYKLFAPLVLALILSALGGFASKMGLACGPMVAGYVLSSEGSYPFLIWAAIGVIALCIAIASFPARRLDLQPQ
jgi:predicted MFS family arabinose efflux permease